MDRKIDFLGRVIIPKEVRNQLNILDNDILNLEVRGEEIVLTKSNKTPIDPRRTTIFKIDEKRTKRIKERKTKYKPGTKVKCLAMESEKYPIPLNMVGTVIETDDIGSVHIKWKNGLVVASLDIPGDTIEIITEKEFNNYKG